MATEAEIQIRRVLGERGRITFSEFMRLALYGPGGYYRVPGRVGTSGDYFTSPQAHPAFGALLGAQLREFWTHLGKPSRFTTVELGAGDGTLAADISDYAPAIDPDFADALDYHALDLIGRSGGHFEVRDATVAPDIGPFTGCVLSNELLDAMPVHRFRIEGGDVREVYVTVEKGVLMEATGEPSSPELEERIGGLSSNLPEGFTGEVNLELEGWSRSLASMLVKGYVVTIDYGHPRGQLYSPLRARGTLRTYFRHTYGMDPLHHVGEQDITSHVDFTALDDCLASVGFRKIGRSTQREFLMNLGLGILLERTGSEGFSGMEPGERAGMLELIKPDGMGAFVVSVHSRGTLPVAISGLSGPPPTFVKGMLLPRLSRTGRHVRMVEEMYPAARAEFPTWEQIFSEEN